MLIAGEASGDMLAAELVEALRSEFEDAEAILTTDYQPLCTGLAPRFFGAGGPRMAAAGVELAFDMTVHSVIGPSGALKNYFKFRRLFNQLYRLAIKREPEAIICVDFSVFNRRFAHAVKTYVRSRLDWFHDWDPKIIQYVSPQVWASREGRAYQMARDYDLLLSIFPFEKEWYAKRVPQFRVEFVGHPVVDRYSNVGCGAPNVESSPAAHRSPGSPSVLLLPGSRSDELARHLPVMNAALEIMRESIPNLRGSMVLPSERLVEQASRLAPPADIEIRSGGLAEALRAADVAIASTGTVTMECAYFGVPTVALYKTFWGNYLVGRQLVKVKHLAMPNLMAKEEVFPEFIQGAATPENIARAALALLRNEDRRSAIKARLAEIVAGLGRPGASQRAARAVLRLLDHEPAPTSRPALAG